MELSEQCEFIRCNVTYVCITPIFNVYQLEYFMKQATYNMMLQVWEKQKNGDRLFDAEIKWKKRYNKSREESVSEVDGIKVTRYKPAWVASKVM